MPFDNLHSDRHDLSEKNCKSQPSTPRVPGGCAPRAHRMPRNIESLEGWLGCVGEEELLTRPGVPSVLVIDLCAVRGNPACSDNREGKVSDAR
jgi:hypothetical protein